MSVFKFTRGKDEKSTMMALIQKLKFMFSNLDSTNVKELDFSKTNVKTSRHKVCIFDDFFYQTLDESDTLWVLNSGADAQASDPYIDGSKGGIIRLQSGNADGTMANDGSQMVAAIPVRPEDGGLIFETRLKMDTISNISVNAGFTDSKSLEEPFEISGASVTSNCSDGACFVYDSDSTSDEWFAVAVDSNNDDTGNDDVGESPEVNIYRTLRIELNEDGDDLKFYIDGELVKHLSGSFGVSPDADLYATVSVCSTTTSLCSVYCDYIYIEYTR